MAKKFVFSTLANDQVYNIFPKRTPGGVSTPDASILIRGGAGVAGDWLRLQTPKGVGTPVTDEQIALLKTNATFKIHEANGYVVIEDGDFDADDVAAHMSDDDPSRPMTEKTAKEAAPGVETITTNVDTPAPAADKKGK